MLQSRRQRDEMKVGAIAHDGERLRSRDRVDTEAGEPCQGDAGESLGGMRAESRGRRCRRLDAGGLQASKIPTSYPRERGKAACDLTRSSKPSISTIRFDDQLRQGECRLLIMPEDDDRAVLHHHAHRKGNPQILRLHIA